MTAISWTKESVSLFLIFYLFSLSAIGQPASFIQRDSTDAQKTEERWRQTTLFKTIAAPSSIVAGGLLTLKDNPIFDRNEASFGMGIFSSSDTTEDSSWRLIKDKDLIKVFVRDNPNGYEGVRVKMNIHGSLADFQKILSNVKGYRDWVYKCSGSEQLSKPGDKFLIYRVTTDFPFPFRDRELTVRSLQWIAPDGTFYSKSSVFKMPDDQSKNVVIHHFHSLWKVREIDHELLSIQYEVNTEPGGNIPAWLYNLAVDQGPFQTMKALKAIVENNTI